MFYCASGFVVIVIHFGLVLASVAGCCGFDCAVKWWLLCGCGCCLVLCLILRVGYDDLLLC